MRRAIYIALLLTATVLCAFAQPQASWVVSKYDMGVIKEADGKKSCQLLLKNTGNEPLFIVKAQASCGCTAVDYPQDAIAPGDTVPITVTYNPSGRPGQFTKQVLIFTNTVPKRTVLEIIGNVIPTERTLDRQFPLRAGALRISQQSIPFGELVAGKNKTEYLSAYNSSTDTIVVSVSPMNLPHVKPAVVPDTVPPAKVSALTVHYITDKAPQFGLNVDTLTLTCNPLHSTVNDIAGEAQVHVMAQVMENFDKLTDEQRSKAPVVGLECGDRIDFGSLPAGQVVTRTFQVTNKGKNPLDIRRLWVPEGEGVKVTADRMQVKRNKTATITVSVDTSQLKDGLLNVPLTLLCNDPESPKLTIRLVGIVDK